MVTEENVREKFEDLVADLNTLNEFCRKNKIEWSINSSAIGCFLCDTGKNYKLSKITKITSL